MAAVSAWAKPGPWALDAEEQEATMEVKEKGSDSSDSSSQHHNPSDEFPSLAAAAAAATKTSKKKKKAQTLSLAEFTTGGNPVHGAGRRPQPSSSSKGLTTGELLRLPSGPREHTAEELERSSRGFGYSSYGGSRNRSSEDPYPRSGASRVADEHHEPRRGGAGGGFDRDSGHSRADEIDNWATVKKSVALSVPERRERGGGFFDSQSRADESDSWVTNKATPPPSNGRRIGGGGFDGPGERRGGFEMFNREGSNGGRVDSDTWGKRTEEASGGGGRPKLVLQARSLPLANGNNNNGEPKTGEQLGSTVKSKGSNPFGEARPREEVLMEKGQDWKDIDGKLESVKIREAQPEGQSFSWKKGFGVGNGQGGGPELSTERPWKKADPAEAPPPRAEKVEELHAN